ncbi:hypothetical protein FOA52_002369 [Chlamydomonas sp. UWO 241]|nr:hypothetical protein FOA52_002369 [Chlamydomonas sp. UWO 241]
MRASRCLCAPSKADSAAGDPLRRAPPLAPPPVLASTPAGATPVGWGGGGGSHLIDFSPPHQTAVPLFDLLSSDTVGHAGGEPPLLPLSPEPAVGVGGFDPFGMGGFGADAGAAPAAAAPAAYDPFGGSSDHLTGLAAPPTAASPDPFGDGPPPRAAAPAAGVALDPFGVVPLSGPMARAGDDSLL